MAGPGNEWDTEAKDREESKMTQVSSLGDCKDRDTITEIENSGGGASLGIEVHHFSFSSFV